MSMDKTLRRYTSLDAMKADEYRAWQQRPACERLNAVTFRVRVLEQAQPL